MTKFVIRRFIGLFPTLFIIITLSFFIVRAAPGGPFDREKRLLIIDVVDEMNHVPVAALKGPDGMVQVPDLAPEFDPIFEG